MKKNLFLTSLIVFAASGSLLAQTDLKTKKNDKKVQVGASANSAVKKNATPLELAKSALQAHGGDKFKNMKTLVVSGTADVSGSPSMTFPAPFIMTYSGDKYRLEITTPFLQFKQIYDGQQTFSSTSDVSLPPINRLGLPLLAKIDEKDFTVSALMEKDKKKTGFRITSPEGFYTDFFIDEKNGQVKGYEASYEIRGKTITTAVEIDKIREVDGVKVPERYAQRFETGTLTIYADFKAKSILVNSPLADDIFVMK
jgi:hypothetical protein